MGTPSETRAGGTFSLHGEASGWHDCGGRDVGWEGSSLVPSHHASVDSATNHDLVIDH
jgi:hypothetical protein